MPALPLVLRPGQSAADPGEMALGGIIADVVRPDGPEACPSLVERGNQRVARLSVGGKGYSTSSTGRAHSRISTRAMRAKGEPGKHASQMRRLRGRVVAAAFTPIPCPFDARVTSSHRSPAVSEVDSLREFSEPGKTANVEFRP